MRTAYQTIVIGGGIMGAATVRYLARDNGTDVLLMERNHPVRGATAKAATLLSLARQKRAIVPFVRETYRLIEELGGESLGFRRVGAIHAAIGDEGMQVIDKTAAVSLDNGVFCREVPPEEVRRLVPWMGTGALTRAHFYEEEGFVDAYRLTMACLDEAREGGVVVAAGVDAEGIEPLAGGGYEIVTNAGRFHAQSVVLAAGAWSNLLLERLGILIPYTPVRSQYWLTGHDPEHFPADGPVTILPEARAYTRPENGSLIFGWREREGIRVTPHDIPADAFEYRFEADPDGWENLEGCVESLQPFFPALPSQGISGYVAGFSTYTPDGLFNVGELPGLPGLYTAAGCAGMGIAVCGGVARALAESIMGGRTSLPIKAFSPARFGKIHAFSADFMDRCRDARSGKKTG